MADDSPYEIMAYDKSRTFMGWVGGPKSVDAVVRYNAVSTADLVVDTGHHRAADLAAKGARCLIYREGEYLLGGMVKLAGGSGPGRDSSLTFSLQDDFRKVHDIVGLPVPNAALTAQNVEYDKNTGPAESVYKTLVRDNMVTRLGMPVTVAPDLGRGTTITTTHRFHPIYDRLFPAFDTAGLGVSIRQQGNVLVADVYVPRTYPRALSEESGTITEWSYTLAAPTLTRAFVGGQGEGTAREFRLFRDTGREADYGDIIETLVDARDSSSGDVFADRAAEALAEGAPLSGVSVKLSETANFQYGTANGLRVGDRIPIQVGTDTITEVMREAVFSWSKDGDEATPVIGERKDDPNKKLGDILRRLAKDNRDGKAR